MENVGAVLIFEAVEAASSMASEVKTFARFGLSGPNYLLGPDFEAEIDLNLRKIILRYPPRTSL